VSPSLAALPTSDQIAAWCREHLGAEPTGVIFEAQHLSYVQGLRLTDGREVVLKARAPSPRIAVCQEVQRFMWGQGFACPEPLGGPAPLGRLTATAERYLPGGISLNGHPGQPSLSAAALCEFVRVASRFPGEADLRPAPPWVGWEHDGAGMWPDPDDLDVDLNGDDAPAWLEELGGRSRARLLRDDRSRIIGHADWWEPNLRWQDGRLHAVFDWDSLAYLSEAAIAGAAAAQFADQWPDVTGIEDCEAFIESYALARGRPWSRDEREVCWAAGLWLMSFNAKKQPHQGVTTTIEHLRVYGAERLRRAGG
jgi:hypothetical protein